MALPKIPLSQEPVTGNLLAKDRLPVLRSALDETDPAKRNPTASLTTVAAALKPVMVTAANSWPTAEKRVVVVSPTSAGYAAGMPTRDTLDPAFLCLGTRCRAEFADGPNRQAGQVDILVYDGAARTPAGSGLQVFRDGDFTGPLVPAKWVDAGTGAAGVPAYPQFPAGYVFAVDQLVRAFVSGNSTELFFAAKAATALPAPSAAAGDANWRLVAQQDVPPAAPVVGVWVPFTGTATSKQNVTQGQIYYVGSGAAWRRVSASGPAGAVGPEGPDWTLVNPAAAAALLPGYAKAAATRAIAATDSIGGALGLLEAGITATATPVATATTSGTVKLFTALGTATDGTIDQNTLNTALNGKAPLASPALTGTPTAPTAATSDSSTTLANTALVANKIAAAIGIANFISADSSFTAGSIQNIVPFGSTLVFTSTAPGQFVIPNDTRASLAAGVTYYVRQGAGTTITVVPEAGYTPATITVLGGGAATTNGVNDTLLVQKTGANQWLVGRVFGVSVAQLETVRNSVTIGTSQAAAYTLAGSDTGNLVPSASTTAVTWTVPANTFNPGQIVEVIQNAAGQVTLAGGTGMTLTGMPGLKTSGTAGSRVQILFMSATTAYVYGTV